MAKFNVKATLLRLARKMLKKYKVISFYDGFSTRPIESGDIVRDLLESKGSRFLLIQDDISLLYKTSREFHVYRTIDKGNPKYHVFTEEGEFVKPTSYTELFLLGVKYEWLEESQQLLPEDSVSYETGNASPTVFTCVAHNVIVVCHKGKYYLL